MLPGPARTCVLRQPLAPAHPLPALLLQDNQPADPVRRGLGTKEQAAATCLVTLLFLVPKMPETEKATRSFDKNRDLPLTTVEDEDWVVAKTISEGLAHGDRPELIYGRNEKATQLLHSQLARDVDSPDAAEPEYGPLGPAYPDPEPAARDLLPD